ncbi:MAG TPA: hypothetical protein VM571_03930 [Noviherbaspirillum sp.]|nr:hypothetical protein [Noviherbaspirillum sp.]
MGLRRHSSLYRASIAALLLVAILFAQWSGLHHRIEHAGFAHESLHTSSPPTEKSSTDARHSCVAFDAAAIADTIVIHPYATAPLASAYVLALWTAFDSWNAPLACHFSSRAPPLA